MVRGGEETVSCEGANKLASGPEDSRESQCGHWAPQSGQEGDTIRSFSVSSGFQSLALPWRIPTQNGGRKLIGINLDHVFTLSEYQVASAHPGQRGFSAHQKLSEVSHSFTNYIGSDVCAAGGFQSPYIRRYACMEQGLSRRLMARGIPLHTPGWRISLRFGMQLSTWKFHYAEKQQEKSAEWKIHVAKSGEPSASS